MQTIGFILLWADLIAHFALLGTLIWAYFKVKKSDMRIIKTSKEKADEEKRRQKAYLQAMECPECGEKTSFLNRVPLLLSGTTRHIYHCECEKCGCEWETDEW